METIRALNQWISGFCAKRNCSYLDYFTAMTDPAGFLKQDLAEDGLHPNAAGYRVMAPLASEAIAKALPGQTPPQPKKEKKRFPF
jgi:lysophospholipase L1-like esterase